MTVTRGNALERAARNAWLQGAVDARYGKCATCLRIRDADGRHLFVARQPRRDYECLECFDARQSDQGVRR